MKIVLLGPPGAGKGTQAARLAQDTKYEHLSTGEMLRRAVKSGSEIGIRAESFMKNGGLVPDEVVIGIIEDRLKSDGAEVSHIFDGFPRTVTQAEALEEMLGRIDSGLDRVVYFDVPEEVVVERLSGRRTCSKCGANFHEKFVPPKKENICDKCGGGLYQRDDDKPESIRNRLASYKALTSELIEYYDKKKMLGRVAADREPESIYADLKKTIGLN